MIRNGAVVTVTGWLQNVSDFEWGRAVKVAVDVNRKNHQGEWEKVDVTLFDCTTDDRSQYFEGVKQVTVTGRITGTNVFEKRDGSTGFSIKVRADEIRPAIDEKRSEAAVNAVWPTVNPNRAAEEAPF